MSFIPYDKQGGTLWLNGNFAYFSAVLVANIKILNDTSTHTIFSFLFIFGSIIFYILCSLGLNFLQSDELYGLVILMFST